MNNFYVCCVVIFAFSSLEFSRGKSYDLEKMNLGLDKERPSGLRVKNGQK